MIALGCIADDFTGGSDVAAAIKRAGLSVTLLFGVPSPEAPNPRTDAVVVALKTRTTPVGEAVRDSVAALAWLQDRNVDKVYFKYCSTFDSTAEGNIGPVADALLEMLGETTTVICPASPEHGRTTYLGHHFVGDQLLSDSSMRHHPLTPMRDPRLTELMARQTDGAVAKVTVPIVSEGSKAVAEHIATLRSAGTRYVVADALTDRDLAVVAAGATSLRMLTGGAGLAGAWSAVLCNDSDHRAQTRSLPTGEAVVLAGSCSTTTLRQVGIAAEYFPFYRLDPSRTPDPEQMLDDAVEWLRRTWGDGPVLIYSSAGPEERRASVAAMGPTTAAILEFTLGRIAQAAVALGAERVVVAGGETSGAVVQALGLDTVEVAGEADQGVPWCLTDQNPPLAVLLKSGNFGSDDLLVRATKEQLS